MQAQNQETNNKPSTVFVIKLVGNYGYVAVDPKARKGHFFHKSQIAGLRFEDLSVGREMDLDGQLVEGDKGPAILGLLRPLGALKALAEAREKRTKELEEQERVKRVSSQFVDEYRARFHSFPLNDMVKTFLKGGWALVDQTLQEEAARRELVLPPPKPLNTRQKIRVV
jgi:hypothetical protein